MLARTSPGRCRQLAVLLMMVLLGMGQGLPVSAQRKVAAKTGGDEKTAANLVPVTVYRKFSEWVVSVGFTPDEKMLIAGSYESAKVFDLAEKKERSELKLGGYVPSVVATSDSRTVVTAAYQRVVLWDISTGKEIRSLTGHRGQVQAVAMSPSGDLLASGSDDGAIKLWQIDTGKEVLALAGHELPVTGLAFSPDGRRLASSSGNETRPTKAGEVVLWDVETGQVASKLGAGDKAVTGVAFSPDGKVLASGSYDETIHVFDATSGQVIRTLEGHSRPITAVVFSPDGSRIASSAGGRFNGKNTAKLWDVATGKEVATFEAHDGPVTCLAISPSGKWLATGSRDKTVMLWDVSKFTTREVAKADAKATATDNVAVTATEAAAQADKPVAATKELKAGIIGLDTSHAIAFTKTLNAATPKPEVAGCRIVAAYPKGSPDIKSSVERVPDYIEQMKKLNVDIVDSIDELVKRVDVVFLETNDGRPHLEQVLPVLKAGKPVFIDKPIAGSLADAITIFEAAKKHKVPLFSSSSLRFGKNTLAVRGGSLGKVTRCETSSPASLEATHPDLFWYGIHGVESLFTVMGTGCQSVTRGKTADGMIEVTGKWAGDRVGIFREGKGYTGKASGEKGESPVGSYDGYDPLVTEIVKFFRTGIPPVTEAETLEIYAYMEAADESKRQNGVSVTLESVMAKAREAAKAK
ncbi:MAG: Gfo/Idh/MocA family oxidoreductase [Planctomycetales bacterium]|nr:Gfo/Idh/MocA family oxidoreductase [Planctomycetales bacterium]